MRLIKKIFLVSGVFLCFITVILSGLGLYVYYHPERIKPMIERSLSATSGYSCTIESISWRFQPMVLEARGILFKTIGLQQTFSMDIPFVRTDMTVEGSWGHRSLILENIQMNGISVNATLPVILPGGKRPSWGAGMIKSLVNFFFFRDIRFRSGEILDGQILASWGDQTVMAHHIHAKAENDKPLVLSFAMEIKNPTRKLHVTAPKVNLSGSNAFNMKDLTFSGTLQAEDVNFQDTELEIRRVDVQSRFIYSHTRKKLDVENLQVHCGGIALSLDSRRMGSTTVSVSSAESLSMQTALKYDISVGEIAFAPLKIDINGLTLIEKSTGSHPLMDVSLQADGISIRSFVVGITNVTLQIPRMAIRTGTRDTLIRNTQIRIPDGRIDMEKKSIALPNIRFDTSGLKNILLAVERKDSRINLTLQGKKTAFLEAAAAFRLLPHEWNLSATDSIRVQVAGPEAGPWQVQVKLSLEELVVKNKDGSLLGENIILTTDTEGIIDFAQSGMTFAVALEAKAGEALYNRYYVNLAQNPVVMSCNGTYQFQQKFLQFSRLRFDLIDILPLEIQGFLKGPSLRDADFTVNIPQVSLKPIFHHLLLEPYKAEKPYLANIEAEGIISA
ncbi:MAG: hypothetical protein WA151_02135, partial [Desulfatirhabdiaceae bacterium]